MDVVGNTVVSSGVDLRSEANMCSKAAVAALTSLASREIREKTEGRARMVRTKSGPCCPVFRDISADALKAYCSHL